MDILVGDKQDINQMIEFYSIRELDEKIIIWNGLNKKVLHIHNFEYFFIFEWKSKPVGNYIHKKKETHD